MILLWGSVIIAWLVAGWLAFYKFYFLRDPIRTIPPGNNIVSPADGKIIKIIEYDKKTVKLKKGLFGKIITLSDDVAPTGYFISIMLTVFDVHFQRAPITGQVLKTHYSKGKFIDVVNNRDSLLVLENEKNEILFKNKDLKVKVIQIAGFLARRIHCFVKKSDQMLKGERIGLISLGSQVVLILPKTVKLKIQKGQRVVGGQTIIAEY
ncbi:phosphatidylserine decarboxylase family protein [Candidatus Woesearchaeota archaeon]|nr:phosphatidylserine decarboxylase family protein [Candidatus Woesearchaeota archaeon]